MPLTPAEAAELAALKERREKLLQLELAHSYRPGRELQPHQKPPETDWRIWVMKAGRGAGKTFAGSDWLNDQCVRVNGLRSRVIAPTYGDAVASFVEGVDGLIAASNGTAVFKPSEPGGSCVVYPNGSRVWLLGTNSPKDVDRLRALTNIDVDVFEEFFANPRSQEAWDQAAFSRRRGQRRAIVTSTPRPHEIWKVWEADPTVTITAAITSDNTKNDPAWVAEQEAKYKGTRLYRQEFLGEVLDDVEGALWTQHDIDRSMEGLTWAEVTAPGFLVKVAIGVDPPSGSGTCGIVVVGLGRDRHLYVLEDLSVSDVLPNEWASIVVDAHRRWEAIVVAEINQGGRMVTETLRAADKGVPVKTENASVGKKTRAEPIALLWEAELQSAHMVEEERGSLAKLIDQLTGWVPPGVDSEGKERPKMPSPDRMDAMVWACTYLRRGVSHTGGVTRPKGTMPKRALTSTRVLR